MKKLIILTDNFFTKRDYNRREINKASQSLNVSVVDVTCFVNKKYYAKHYNKKSFYKNKNYKLSIIKNYKDLNIFFSDLDNKKNKYYVLDVFTSNHSKIHYIKDKIYAHANTKFIGLFTGFFPAARIVEKLSVLNFQSNFIGIIKNYFLRKISSLKPNKLNSKNHKFLSPANYSKYDVKIVTSLKNQLIGNNSVNQNNQIFSHTNDYDLFLESKRYKEKKLLKKNYAVYIDEIMIDHPDFSKLTIKNPISKKKYNEELSYFFEKFTKETGIEIVVAHHPRRKIPRKKVNLKISTKTPDLVKNAQYVMLHSSTAVSYAILNNKPLIYLDSDNFGWQRPRIAAFHNQTGGIKINIAKKYKKDQFKRNFNNIDKEKYKNYIKNYLKHPKSKYSIIESIIQYCNKN